MTPIEIAGLTLTVIAILLGWWTHYEWLPVWWWPLVGSEWRAERRAVSVPADTIPDGPDEAWREMVALGQELEPLDHDEWEQLDPDTAAATLIAEWHAPEAEYIPDTGQMALLDDLHVLAWDAGRQVAMIRDIRNEWRQQTADPLLAWFEDRRAA